ncbi:MAG: DUF3540 domain-containing protein [Polyangiaceae bacterium]|nr:DUF3540 domain-containing protein [Polyangiaceae bacterium]
MSALKKRRSANLHVVELKKEAAPEQLQLTGGALVQKTEHGADILDVEGRLLIRFENGRAEVYAPQGDVVFAAPKGNIVFQAGKDLTLESVGPLTQRSRQDVAIFAGDRTKPQLRVEEGLTTVHTDRVEVRSSAAQVVVEHISTVAHRVVNTATTVLTRAERFEVQAEHMVERTRDKFVEAKELVQVNAGRARTLVKELYSVFSGRTTMESKDETSIDGKRVLLG